MAELRARELGGRVLAEHSGIMAEQLNALRGGIHYGHVKSSGTSPGTGRLPPP
ncbi:MAG TPA: hypothetical protein VIG90_18875 [Pedomonas sp.]|uniref:hypothetical protein n=1 Tax=Pedomonas sp. TaxID=2976421 RepID=UPI002F42C573